MTEEFLKLYATFKTMSKVHVENDSEDCSLESDGSDAGTGQALKE